MVVPNADVRIGAVLGSLLSAVVVISLCVSPSILAQDCDDLPRILRHWGNTIYHSSRISNTNNPDEVVFLRMDDDLPKAVIERIPCLTHLDALTLRHQRFSQYDPLATIGRLRFLTSVSLSDCDLTSADFTHLARLPRLRTLDLSGSRLPASWAQSLASGSLVLSELSLQSTNAVDADLFHLAKLPYLYRLDMSDTSVTGDVSIPPGSFAMLYGLNVRNCPIADAGLKRLLEATGLEELNISGSRVTDASVALLAQSSSPPLVGLSRVLSPEAVRRLQRLRPALAVMP